ncbi:DUF998 domain-containing protein [Arthrobacter sedimenti]|uniref:DUF998 domain-containing protein n=1 Tax=Arthrobacter sedimenti TaxID=2694931 RepID=UPI000B56D83E|nr:DUF998 domain-containing protein [Arthrobacter sedimenti]OUM43261.1 hypothetical protein B8W73_04900 [Arthrobacter agilis]
MRCRSGTVIHCRLHGSRRGPIRLQSNPPPGELTGAGPGRWIQALNFSVNGLLYLGLAAGLAHRGDAATPRAGPLLIGAAGLGQIIAGLFTTDPVSGYPPGTPATLDHYGRAGARVHDLVAVPVFLGIPAAALLWARTFARHGCRRWSRYSGTTAGTMVIGFMLTSAAFAQAPVLAPIGGLLQRLTVTLDMGWLSALSVQALITPPPPSQAAKSIDR